MAQQIPKVSVCMPTYNHERYIAQAIESVLKQQTDFAFELVIGDDHSTDRAGEIISRYVNRQNVAIRILPRPENLGRPHNFIDIFSACRGDYIAVLEGDDYWTSERKLQRQVDFLSTHPEYAICFHPVQVIDETGKRANYIFPPESRREVFDFPTLLKGNFMQTCSVMYRRYADFSFPPWFKQAKLGDWPLHLLMASHGKIAFLDEVMAVYRIHQGGLWGNKPKSETIPAVIGMYRLVDGHFSGRYHSQIRECISSLHYVLGNLQLQENRRREAMGSAWESLCACRSTSINTWKNRCFLLAKSLLPGNLRKNRIKKNPSEE
jgi:glycosyltransferase involved in cell wall biosynthesis